MSDHLSTCDEMGPLSLLLEEVEIARAGGDKRLAINLIKCIYGWQDQQELIDRLTGHPALDFQGDRRVVRRPHVLQPAAEAVRDVSMHAGDVAAGTFGVGRSAAAAGVSFFEIAEEASDVILVTTAELDEPGQRIVYANAAFTRLTGYDAADVIGRSPRMLHGPGTSRRTLDRIREGLSNGVPVQAKVLNYTRNGSPFWLDLRIVPLKDATGAISHFAAIERDVTMDKRRMDDLECLEDRDPLTGISNCRALLRALADEIKNARSRAPDVADTRSPCLALIDIAGFEEIKDRLGPSVADAVLCGLADRLAENVRRSDALGRIAEEEFGVCMPLVTLRNAVSFADHLCHAVAAEPIATPCGPVSISVNISVAAMEPGENLLNLMDRAKAALRDKRSHCMHQTVALAENG